MRGTRLHDAPRFRQRRRRTRARVSARARRPLLRRLGRPLVCPPSSSCDRSLRARADVLLPQRAQALLRVLHRRARDDRQGAPAHAAAAGRPRARTRRLCVPLRLSSSRRLLPDPSTRTLSSNLSDLSHRNTTDWPASEMGVPHVCRVRRLDFHLVNVFQFGLLPEDEALTRHHHFLPPGDFEGACRPARSSPSRSRGRADVALPAHPRPSPSLFTLSLRPPSSPDVFAASRRRRSLRYVRRPAPREPRRASPRRPRRRRRRRPLPLGARFVSPDLGRPGPLRHNAYLLESDAAADRAAAAERVLGARARRMGPADARAARLVGEAGSGGGGARRECVGRCEGQYEARLACVPSLLSSSSTIRLPS